MPPGKYLTLRGLEHCYCVRKIHVRRGSNFAQGKLHVSSATICNCYCCIQQFPVLTVLPRKQELKTEWDSYTPPPNGELYAEEERRNTCLVFENFWELQEFGEEVGKDVFLLIHLYIPYLLHLSTCKMRYLSGEMTFGLGKILTK